MKKNQKTEISWDIDPNEEEQAKTTEPVAPGVSADSSSPAAANTTTASDKKSRRISRQAIQFDLEGLQTDFPTARDLERFVYDRTGYILNLKGLANAVKYQIAMDTLNGIEPDPELITSENPYLEKTEQIPTDPLKAVPPRDPRIDTFGPEVNIFDTGTFPHPDPDWRSQDKKANVVFRKYANGAITYEIIGPIAQRAIGVKVNKFGTRVPEKLTWVDPRTGEQIIKNSDGSFTPLGTRLRAFMRKQRMNNSNQWDIWIDRDFVVKDSYINDNPWQNT